MHRPVGRIAAERFRELLRSFGEQVAEPALAPSRHVQELLDGFDVAPFELQANGATRTEETLLPCFERDSGAAGKMTALYSQVIDLLGKVEHRVAFDAEIEKGVEPFTAGVEAHHGAFKFAFA